MKSQGNAGFKNQVRHPFTQPHAAVSPSQSAIAIHLRAQAAHRGNARPFVLWKEGEQRDKGRRELHRHHRGHRPYWLMLIKTQETPTPK